MTSKRKEVPRVGMKRALLADMGEGQGRPAS